MPRLQRSISIFASRRIPLFNSYHITVRSITQGKHFAAACEGLPSTPSGHNPYEVLQLSLHSSLSQGDIAKQYRQLVVQCHPDKPGGSTERMTEVNLAYKILKEHHDAALRRLQRAEEEGSTKGSRGWGGKMGSTSEHHSPNQNEFTRRARRQNPSSNPRPARRRSFPEIITYWETLSHETEEAAKFICSRYEVAIQQGKFLREANMLNEITARERWIRKSFIKSLWENVHELRGELLHRGVRSAQHSELAENMVLFASQIQRKLNEDFQKQTQGSVQHQIKMIVERGLLIVLFFILLVRMWQRILGKGKKVAPKSELKGFH